MTSTAPPVDYHVSVICRPWWRWWITLAVSRCISPICPWRRQAAEGLPEPDGSSAELFVRCRHGDGYATSDIDRLNMQRYFYAGLFARLLHGRDRHPEPAAAGVQELYQDGYGHLHHRKAGGVLPKKIDSSNIILEPDAGVHGRAQRARPTALRLLLGEPMPAPLQHCSTSISAPTPAPSRARCTVTDQWPHGTASTDANVQYMGRIDKESDDAILNGNTGIFPAL